MKSTPIKLFLAAIFPLIVSCGKAQKLKEHQQASHELQQLQNSLNDDDNIDITSQAVEGEALQNSQDTAETEANQSTEKLREAMKIGAELQQEMKILALQHQKLTASVTGTMNWAELDKNRDFDARRITIIYCIDLNQRILKWQQSFEKTYKDRLDAIGYSGPNRAMFDRGIYDSRKGSHETIQAMRNAEIEMMKVVLSILDRLEERGDDWRWSETDENVIFTNDEDNKWFERQMAEIARCSELQIKALEQYRNFQKTK